MTFRRSVCEQPGWPTFRGKVVKPFLLFFYIGENAFAFEESFHFRGFSVFSVSLEWAGMQCLASA